MDGQTDLSDLIARVEAATDELDLDTLGRVICAALGETFGSADICCGDDGSDHLEVEGPGYERVWGGYRDRAPDVSVDAALEMIERVVHPRHPQMTVHFRTTFSGSYGKHTKAEITVPSREFQGLAHTAPLALCVALLRAKAAQS